MYRGKNYTFQEAIERLNQLPKNKKNYAVRLDKDHDSDYKCYINTGILQSLAGGRFIMSVEDLSSVWGVVEHPDNKDIVCMEEWLTQDENTNAHSVRYLELGVTIPPNIGWRKVKLMKSYEVNISEGKDVG